MAVQMAVRLSLLAFAATCLQGLVTSGDLSGVLQLGLLRIAEFYVAGLLCGGLAGWLAEEHARGDFARWRESRQSAQAASEAGA